jgi:hypothetical protein
MGVRRSMKSLSAMHEGGRGLPDVGLATKRTFYSKLSLSSVLQIETASSDAVALH